MALSCIRSEKSSSSSNSKDFTESQAIPLNLVKEEWQQVLSRSATKENLQSSIQRCKELILSTEENSEERHWAVRHLIELKLRLLEIQSSEEDPLERQTGIVVILGHHFKPRELDSVPSHKKIYCDHCSGIIWSVVQASYVCTDCFYSVHHKCLHHVLRICAHVIATERGGPIIDICPEIGIEKQDRKCYECQTDFKYSEKNKTFETMPRLCDYTGRYYCSSCHWDNKSIIPARIINDWHFRPRKVSRASLQEIAILYDKPVINLQKLRPELFISIDNLKEVKFIRQDLAFQRKYLSECRFAIDEKILETHAGGSRRHLIQSPDYFSIADLIGTNDGSLIESLKKMSDIFFKHISDCVICRGKGYLCEVCKSGEPIFPFNDAGFLCDKCNSMLHHPCCLRKQRKCVKCERLRRKREDIEVEEVEEGDNQN